MVVNRIRTLVFASVFCLASTGAWGAGLEARLGHATVREGEPVELLLRAPADGGVATPDLSPLAEDFEILGTQQSRRLSIVNGRREASIDWTVTLLPRHKGDIVVPPIRAGAASSEPLRLRVADAPAPPSRADAPDLFVESSVDQMSPYVQGEVQYSVRVYDGIGIRGGGLTEPRAENARVRSIGEGRTYEETVNGRRYRVHEQQYSITPQTSGTMTIAPVTLEARVEDPNVRGRSPFDGFFGGRDPFADMFGRSGFGSSLFDDMFRPGRQVRVRSNTIEIDVQARPDGATEGWFLPAKHVELAESFEPAMPSFRVGEAVKRTVVLRALGATAEQLPEFEIPAAAGVRQYDEGTRHGSVPTDDGTVSVREQTIAMVPSGPGTVVLPPVEVRWWDAEKEEPRTATLPERTIEVAPAPGQAMPDPAAAPVVVPPAVPAPATASSAPVEGDGSGLPDVWLWAAALTLVALAAGGGHVLARRRNAPSSGSSREARPAEILAEVQAACRSGDAAAARDALLRWARRSFGVGAPGNPRAIARKLGHPGFEQEAAKLDRSLYAPGADPFDGESFWRELRAAARGSAGNEEGLRPAVLPELYPSS